MNLANMIRRIAVISTLALLASACGSGSGGDSGVRPRVHLILMSHYPHAASTGALGAYTWAASYKAPGVRFFPSSQSVASSGERVMAVQAITDGGTQYLLVSSIDSNGIFILDRFHDVTDDGIPDQSTRTTLINGGSTPRYVTSIYARSRSEIYFLDSRQGDILVALGSGGNWVNGLRSEPYAAYSTYPDLQSAHTLLNGTTTIGTFGIVASPTAGGDSASMLQELPWLLFPDADNDRYADSMIEQSTDFQPIVEGARPFAGQTSIVVRRVGSTVTRVIEVRGVNLSTFAETSILGSVSMTAVEDTKEISLSGALSSGEAIAIRYQGSGAIQRTIYSVLPAWPQVLGASAAAIPPNTSASVVFTGVNFTSGMTLKLMQHRTDVQTLSFTLNSSTSATATIPASASLSLLNVYALAPGQDDTDMVGAAQICVSNN